jgi:hypothetical protein
VHEQKGFVIAAAIAVLGIAQGAEAQKDAAEKAQEGGIDHWIEYYKAQQRKPAAPPRPQPEVPATSQAAPDTSIQGKTSK